MTTMNVMTRQELCLLRLANEMNSASKASRIPGYSRRLLYEFRRRGCEAHLE